MSNIDKRALREAAEKATGAHDRLSVMPADDIFDISLHEGTQLDADITDLNSFNEAANPATVLALLDELDAKDNRINRLEAIVTVAEQRNALMREWKRVLRVPCDLIDDQVPVVIHSMVIRLERLKEAEAKLEAAEKRIAELSHHLQSAHAFIEHTEAFGYEASNGILCCGDAQWNIDASKSALAAADKGEAS